MNRPLKLISLAAGLAWLAASAAAETQAATTTSQSAQAKASNGYGANANAANPNDTTTSRASTNGSMNANDNLSVSIDASRFKSLDTDNDGRLSRAEFALANSQTLQTDETSTAKTEKKHWWNKKKADDKVTTDVNASASSTASFDALDTDKDGYLSSAEVAAQHNSDMAK